MLRSAVNDRAALEFAYGTHDCCAFVRDVVKRVRGVDPAPHLQYTSEAEAGDIIAAHGGLDGLLTSIFGKPVADAMLTTCDVALVRLPGCELMAGVVSPGGVLVPMPRGLERVPRASIVHGWNT